MFGDRLIKRFKLDDKTTRTTTPKERTAHRVVDTEQLGTTEERPRKITRIKDSEPVTTEPSPKPSTSRHVFDIDRPKKAEANNVATTTESKKVAKEKGKKKQDKEERVLGTKNIKRLVERFRREREGAEKKKGKGREEEEPDFTTLLGGNKNGNEELEDDENDREWDELEEKLNEARKAFSPAEAIQSTKIPWRPPTDLRPANRKQMLAPDLESTTGDLVVNPDHMFPTFSLATEPDKNVRLSSSYAKSIPELHLIHLLVPFGYEKRRKFSLESRWESLNTRLNSVQTDTIRGYKRMITRFLEWCEGEGTIEPKDRFPLNPRDVNTWIGSMGQRYSTGYLRAHFNAIEFWHEIHEVPFAIERRVRNRTLDGAKRLGPPKKELRKGLTIEDLIAIRDDLENKAQSNPNKRPANAAVLAAAYFLFFAMGRSKDATLPRRTQEKRISKKDREIRDRCLVRGEAPPEFKVVTTFDTNYDVHGGCFKLTQESDDMPSVYSILIPFDKRRHKDGETIYLAEQKAFDTKICPVDALTDHLAINHPSPTEPSFSYLGDKGERLWLTKAWFVDRINTALTRAGRAKLQGHSFREGGATFFTTAGVHPEVLRSVSRWAGKESFQLYLREKEKIAARHLANLENDRKKKDAVKKAAKTKTKMNSKSNTKPNAKTKKKPEEEEISSDDEDNWHDEADW